MSQPQCAVVGLGLVGAAATRYLAQAGVSVVGIGPGEPTDWESHTGVFSSHYDSGRITRILDQRAEWAELARRSILAYEELATQSGVEFHTPVGVVEASSDPNHFENIRRLGEQLAVPYAEQTGGSDVTHYRLPAEAVVVREPPPAGFIDPRAMLRAQLAAATAAGAALIHAEVAGWKVTTGGVELSLRDGSTVVADSILIAAGAYTRTLLPELTLRVKAEITILGEVDGPVPDMPALLYHIVHDEVDSIYVVPPARYPDGTYYVKLGANAVTDHFPSGKSAMNEWMRSDAIESNRPLFREVLTSILPQLADANLLMKPCLVTYTGHGLPYIDRLADRVVVAAGGNGQGAKSADAIGAIAADLVVRGEWVDSLPADAFRAE